MNLPPLIWWAGHRFQDFLLYVLEMYSKGVPKRYEQLLLIVEVLMVAQEGANVLKGKNMAAVVGK